jgi:hypothetical protein
VRDIFFVEVQTDCQEVRVCLEDMETLTQLGEVASMQLQRVVHHQALFERVYFGTVQVTTLSLHAARRSVEIVGYGNPPHIVNYKNLIGHLLQADLEFLETALAEATRQPLLSHVQLEEALYRFLASPANMHLGKQAFASSSAVPDAFAAPLVSSDYATRASTTLRASIEQVYKRNTPFHLAGLLLLPLPLFFLAHVTGLLPLGQYSPVIAALGAGLVAWILEFLTLRHLSQLLGPTLGASVQNALRQTGALQQRRRWLAAMAVCGVLAGWFGAAMIEASLWARHP